MLKLPAKGLQPYYDELALDLLAQGGVRPG
jgi:hypothetical protein